MSKITTTPGRRQSLSKRLLSVFVVMWANLAFQPCALASGDDHDCPHCPPAQEQGMEAHHGHHGEAEAAQPCASMQSDCCDLTEANVDSRSAQLKIKDLFEQPAIVSVDAPWLDTIHVVRPGSSAGPPSPVAASPPLHLLNCVFLN